MHEGRNNYTKRNSNEKYHPFRCVYTTDREIFEEEHFPEFPEKWTKSRGIPKFFENFLPGIAVPFDFAPEIFG